MEKIEKIKKISEIADDVQENWTANDGGLTWAASDVISLANYLIRKIESEDSEWFKELDPWDYSSGTEQDLIGIAKGQS